MKTNRTFGMIMILICVAFLASACSTGVVPPGSKVIIAKTDGTTETITNGKWTATGRDRVYFLDSKLKSFTEKMEILCADDINMTVEVKWLGSFAANTDGQIKMIVEKVPTTKVELDDKTVLQLSLEQFYKTAVSDIIRANARGIVAPYVTDNIRPARKAIEAAIKKDVLAKLKSLGYPLNTSDVMVSNLDYPDEVTNMRKAIKNAQLKDQEKAAQAKATLAQAKRDEEIAREKGKATIVEAQVEAKPNRFISESITAQILAKKQWDVLGTAAAGENNAIWVLPYEAMKTTDMQQNIAMKSGRIRSSK